MTLALRTDAPVAVPWISRYRIAALYARLQAAATLIARRRSGAPRGAEQCNREIVSISTEYLRTAPSNRESSKKFMRMTW